MGTVAMLFIGEFVFLVAVLISKTERDRRLILFYKLNHENVIG